MKIRLWISVAQLSWGARAHKQHPSGILFQSIHFFNWILFWLSFFFVLVQCYVMSFLYFHTISYFFFAIFFLAHFGHQITTPLSCLFFFYVHSWMAVNFVCSKLKTHQHFAFCQLSSRWQTHSLKCNFLFLFFVFFFSKEKFIKHQLLILSFGSLLLFFLFRFLFIVLEENEGNFCVLLLLLHLPLVPLCVCVRLPIQPLAFGSNFG